MKNLIGKKFNISGMTIEIIADNGETWQTRNLTTGETVSMNKSILHNAIKLGKAEQVTDPDNQT